MVRAADSLSALFVWIGVRELGGGSRGLAVVNLGLVAAWLVIVWRLARRHRTLARPAAEVAS